MFIFTWKHGCEYYLMDMEYDITIDEQMDQTVVNTSNDK